MGPKLFAQHGMWLESSGRIDDRVNWRKLMDNTKKTPNDADLPKLDARRKFLGKSALMGLAGAGVTLGLAGCKEEGAAVKTAAPTTVKAITSGGHEIAPGQLDEYYHFSSAGHGGEARIMGLPSGRTLKRIPVFNTDCMVG